MPAQKYFAGRDPIGQYVDFDPDREAEVKQPPAQIVGVVGHVNQWGLDQDGTGALHTEAYLPYWQSDDKSLVATARFNTIYVRTTQPGVPSLEALRTQLLALDSGLVVYDASTRSSARGFDCRQALLDIGSGMAAALGLTRLMASMLFGVKPTDPLTFAAVAMLLAAIALLACFVPAQKAMRVDPIVALRYE